MSKQNSNALQAAFEAARASDDSFIGEVFSFASKVPNSRCALVVQQVKAASLAVQSSIERLGFSEVTFNRHDWRYYLPNGSEVMFTRAHAEADLVKNGGYEWQLVAVSNIEDMPRDHVAFLRSRLRATGEVRASMELHELPLQIIGRHRNGAWEVIENEPIVIPHVHSYDFGSSKCAGCGAPIVIEGPRQSQIDALSSLLESGTGALTAEELEALPDGSVVITLGEALNYTWTVSEKSMGKWYPFDERMCLFFEEMIDQKTFLLKRGGA